MRGGEVDVGKVVGECVLGIGWPGGGSRHFSREREVS